MICSSVRTFSLLVGKNLSIDDRDERYHSKGDCYEDGYTRIAQQLEDKVLKMTR